SNCDDRLDGMPTRARNVRDPSASVVGRPFFLTGTPERRASNARAEPQQHSKPAAGESLGLARALRPARAFATAAGHRCCTVRCARGASLVERDADGTESAAGGCGVPGRRAPQSLDAG